MSGLQVDVDLGPTVETLGRAVGLLRTSGSGVEVDSTFFAEPGAHLAACLSDPDQRASTLAAIGLLVPADDEGAAGYVLAEAAGLRVELTVTEPAPGDAVLGVRLEASGGVGAVSVDVPVLSAVGNGLDSVVGTEDHPVQVRASATIDDGDEFAVTLLLAGPDVVEHSTLLVSVTPAGDAPVVLDPADRADVGAALAELVRLVVGSGEAPAVTTAHLLGALGLSEGLPPLPLAPAAAGSASAWRAWLGRLLQGAADDGRPALSVWLSHLAALLGGAAGVPPMPAAGAPTDVTVAAPAGGRPGLALRMGTDADLASLSFAVRSWFATVGAELAVQLTMADVPVAGAAPAAVGAAGEVVAAVPAGGRLYPPATTTDPTLRVGRLRAGLTWNDAGTAPLLALDDVRLALPGVEPVEVAELDLTSTDVLVDAGADLLADALRDGLGSSPVALALQRLVGLDPPAGVAAVDAVLLATDPHRALAAYYLGMRAAPAGWAPALGAVWVLLGGTPPQGDLDALLVPGSGSPEDPWRLPLDHLAPSAGGGGGGPAPRLSLTAWDGAAAEPAAPPRFRLGLLAELQARLDETVEPVAAALAVELLGLDVDPVRPAAAHVLGSVGVQAGTAGLELGAADGATVTVDSAAAGMTWSPAQALAFSGSVSGVSVSGGSDGEAVLPVLDLGSGVDLSAPDLGLAGGDAGALWTVARDIAAAAAASLGGTTRLATLLAGTPGDAGSPGLPGLALPDGEPDVRGLLGDLVAALGQWLAATLVDQSGVDAAGRPHVVHLLDRLPALLNGRTGAAAGDGGSEPAPTTGSGTAAAPWSTPVHAPGSPGFEVLSWIDGDGPAADWAAGALGLLAPPPAPVDPTLDAPAAAEDTDAEDTDPEDTDPEADFQPGDASWTLTFAPDGDAVADAVAALSGAGGLPEDAAGDVPGAPLDTLAVTLATSDGLVAAWESVPAQLGWELGVPVAASHWELPADPQAVAQVAAHVRRCTATAASDWTLVLVDAGLADGGAWEPLAGALGLPPPTPASLRVSGVDPLLVDLRGLAAASAYVVDLADDATPVDDLVERLQAALAQIRTVRGHADVVLVGHSWAGLVAAAVATGSPAGVLGLCAVGTPFEPAACVALTDADVADAVRPLLAAFPADGLGAYGRVLPRLGEALDGWRAGGSGGGAVAVPWPPDALGRTTVLPSPPEGMPCLAVQGVLGSDLRAWLRASAWRLGPGAAEPGEVAHGLRLGLDLGAPVDGEADVALSLRLDLGRSRLLPGSPSPAAVEVAADLRQPDGWLLGGPVHAEAEDGTSAPYAGPGADPRLRRARLTARWEPTADGRAGVATTTIDLYDASSRGVGGAALSAADPAAAPVLAALFAELGSQAALGGRVARLLDLLAGIGLVAGTGTSTVLLSDGLAALQGDLTGPVAGRVRALLDRAGGAAGLSAVPGAAAGTGPWSYHHPDLPVLLTVTPREVRVETTGDGFETGHDTWLTSTSTVSLPVPAAATDLTWAAAGGTRLVAEHASGQLRLESPGLAHAATLVPPDADLPEVLAEPALRTLTAAALSGVLARLRPGHSTPWLGGLVSDPVAALTGWVSGGGPAVTGPGDLEPARVRGLLGELAGLCGAAGPPERPLLLPADLGCYAEPSAAGLRLGLRTDGPLDLPGSGAATGSLDVDVWLDLDPAGAATPGGGLGLRLALPGSSWGAVTVALGTGADGPTLSVLPDALAEPITLLPSVGGLDALLGGGAQLLLAAALDALVERLRARPGGHQALDAALAAAAAFGLVDAVTGKFDGAALTAFAADLAAGESAGDPADQARALADVVNVLVPDAQLDATGSTVGLDAALTGGGSLTVSLDLATSPPAVSFGVAGASTGTLRTDVTAHAGAGGTDLSATLAADVDLGRGASLTPALELTAAGGLSRQVTLDALGDGTVALRLAPDGRLPTAAQAGDLASGLGLPLAVRLALGALGDDVDEPLWAGGPTLAELLVGAGLARPGGTPPPSVATSSPSAHAAAAGVLGVLEGSEVEIAGGLAVALAKDGTRYGVALRGDVPLTAGERPATLHLGLPPDVDTGWADADAGLSLLLLDVGSGDLRTVRSVRLDGVGLAVTGAGGPLVDTALVLVGDVGLYGQWELDLDPGVRVVGVPLGALQVGGFGLPLLPSGNDSNPVAASLLASTDGDQAPANPPLDVLVSSVPGGWLLLFGGEPSLRLAVQKTFGPLYLGFVEYAYDPATRTITIAVDGSIAVGPLTVTLSELTVGLPVDTLSNPLTWTLDLAGLAVSLVTETVSVLGALRRLDLPHGDVEYIGGLSVIVPGRTLSAVGSYAQPHDAAGEFTSLFVFLNVPIPLGGPPFFFVLGLAAGVGYNRRLIVPDDPVDVPAFVLVAAMNGDIDLGDDPLTGLTAMAADLPPSRGAYWGAAGVRFTTFGLIQGTALLYVSLDTGVEVGVLGLLELALPPESSATVLSIQLGLAASYSSVDQILSVQAALTESSWLFSPDCRLTGGFAFVAWLATPEVLLTIGGYHPDFDVPDYYPTVDPVGFAWTPLAGISVKGGSYFALTHSALMVGGRLEVSYDRGPVRAWFETSVDVMVTWDPLSFTASLHIGVGASLDVEGCLLVCVTVHVSVSVGADLTVSGPPLRGTASVDLGVTSITVSFGNRVSEPWLSWEEVLARYVTAGSDGPATCTTVTSGRLETEDATAPTGSEDEPWIVGTGFTLATDSPMPCTETLVVGSSAGTHLPSGISAPADVDVVPAGPSIGATEVSLVVDISERTTSGWRTVSDDVVDSLDVSGVQGSYQAAVWQAGRADDPAAPMLGALGGVTLTASTSVEEQTGALGGAAAVPVSTLVEEEPALPLPLHEPPVRWDIPWDFPTRPDLDGGPEPGGPLLLGSTARRSSPDLRGDDTALWDVRGVQRRLRLQVTGSPVRLVALSGTGAPLDDVDVADAGAAGADLLPRGTARMALVPAGEEGRAAGWQLRTPLVPLAAGTFLAPGATVLTGTPVEVHPRYRARTGGLARLRAAAALAGQDVTTTVVRGPGDVLVVQVDTAGSGPGVGDPRIEVRGARLGPVRRLAGAGRVTLVHPLERAAGTALRVRVAGGGGVTAGVVVLGGGVDAVEARLRQRPWQALLSPRREGPPATPRRSRVTVRAYDDAALTSEVES